MTTLSDFTANTLAGEEQQLSTYDGKVVLVVNTASECGFTPQYQGLQELHTKYADDGFAVLGFPCNQFGGQEPGDARGDRRVLREELRRHASRSSRRSTSTATRRTRSSSGFARRGPG